MSDGPFKPTIITNTGLSNTTKTLGQLTRQEMESWVNTFESLGEPMVYVSPVQVAHWERNGVLPKGFCSMFLNHRTAYRILIDWYKQCPVKVLRLPQ